MEKHSETVAELTLRGFDVFSLDWRGQGGATRFLENPQKGYVARYEDYVRDLEVFYREAALAHRRPLVILGHSMGGHIALRFLHDHPDAVDGAVLVSPMIDIHTRPLPVPIVRLLVRLAISLGLERHYCIGSGDYVPGQARFEKNSLTSDFARFMQEHLILEKSPDLALGGVTWAWLHATFRSIDILGQPGFAEGIRTPIRMVCAGGDSVVSVTAQKRISARLPDCRMTLIPGARHEILKEIDPIRGRFWQIFQTFTAALLP